MVYGGVWIFLFVCLGYFVAALVSVDIINNEAVFLLLIRIFSGGPESEGIFA